MLPPDKYGQSDFAFCQITLMLVFSYPVNVVDYQRSNLAYGYHLHCVDVFSCN